MKEHETTWNNPEHSCQLWCRVRQCTSGNVNENQVLISPMETKKNIFIMFKKCSEREHGPDIQTLLESFN